MFAGHIGPSRGPRVFETAPLEEYKKTEKRKKQPAKEKLCEPDLNDRNKYFLDFGRIVL